MRFVRAKVEHLSYLRPPPEQAGGLLKMVATTAEADLRTVVEGHIAFSGWHQGVCMGVAGISEIWPERGLAWAIMSKHSGPHMRQITDFVRGVLEISGHRRIEALVDPDYHLAHKWARWLGFRLEAPRMQAYFPDGQDIALFARVR